ncbi:MAG: FkbM family methyltransferase [Alphaproteobacteria bacterium]|nr:FkbM family methyltransferase [Alphaproteobacteria bacterium]
MIGIPRVASLKALVGADVQVKVVDVGANPIDGAPPYSPLLRNEIADVIGFDPDRASLDELNKRKSARETYLPYAVADGRRHKLHRCFNPGMSSLLEPNKEVLRLFHGFTGWATVLSTEDVETKRLDDIEETRGLDYLKLDIQGAELMALENATDRLRDALVVQVEVEFLRMYVQQPLFGDVASFMQSRGFQFHRFHPLVNRVIVPLALRDDLYAGLSQALWADAVFVRDLTRLDSLSARQLLVLATIMHDCYGSVDLALHVLREHDRRQGTAFAAEYLPRLMVFPKLVDWILSGQPLKQERVPFPKANAPAGDATSVPPAAMPAHAPPSPVVTHAPMAKRPARARKAPERSLRKTARSGR